MRLFKGKYQRLHDKGIDVVFPTENKHHFSSIIGLDTQKEDLIDIIALLNGKKNFPDIGIMPHTRYIFSGISGLGKTSMAMALAKESNIPFVTIDISRLIDTNISQKLLDLVFNFSRSIAPCVLLIREFSSIGCLAQDKQILFSEMLYAKLIDYPEIIVITSLSNPFTFHQSLLQFGAFEKTIYFLPPDFDERKNLIKYFCRNLSLEKCFNLDKLVCDTKNLSAGQILRIVQDTVLYSKRLAHNVITYKDFDDTISALLGEKVQLTKEEKSYIAYHEAGHVVSGYFSNQEFNLSEVGIYARGGLLGCTYADILKPFYSSRDIENKILICFGGMVAEKLIFSNTTSTVSGDLARATEFASLMVKSYGMNETIGFIVLDDQHLNSEELNNIAELEIQRLLQNIYKKAYKLVESHKESLEMLANLLLEKEIVTGEEVKKLFNKLKEVD